MTHTQCELCSSHTDVSTYEVPRATDIASANTVLLCGACREGVESLDGLKASDWHCLNESIWTENPAVKVLAWRVLNALRSEGWAQDLLDQLYMDDELLEWAKAGVSEKPEAGGASAVRDSNGAALSDGDSVTLIKDLDVKGAGFTAKRGTLVKNISLTEDPALIEGKINGTQIVLKTCFLKKAN